MSELNPAQQNPQPAVVPPVVTTQKFPDPLNHTDQQALLPPSTQPPQNLVNKSFWRKVFIILIALPLITGIFMLFYQLYATRSASEAPQIQPAPTIDPSLVVTPESLPTVPPQVATSSATDITTWENVSLGEGRVQFGYPADELTLTQTASIAELEFTENPQETQKMTITLLENKPDPIATISVTRDFGTTEFTYYQTSTQKAWVGQTDQWIEIKVLFDTNAGRRLLLEKIVDTLTVLENPESP